MAVMTAVRESLFLWVGNHLRRLRLFDRGRYFVLRLAGMDIRGRCLIWGPLVIRPIGGAHRITIGAGSFLNTNVRFGAGTDGRITIGQNVLVGPNTSFETVDHGLVYLPGRGRGSATKPIVIEDEVWIGAGTIVLQGVTIGRGSVITAGALVRDDVPAGTVAGGVPAQVLRAIDDAMAEIEPRPTDQRRSRRDSPPT
jgi:acetyltransferase-like isoleucine patch superfamily enzyme